MGNVINLQNGMWQFEFSGIVELSIILLYISITWGPH